MVQTRFCFTYYTCTMRATARWTEICAPGPQLNPPPHTCCSCCCSAAAAVSPAQRNPPLYRPQDRQDTWKTSFLEYVSAIHTPVECARLHAGLEGAPGRQPTPNHTLAEAAAAAACTAQPTSAPPTRLACYICSKTRYYE